MLVPSCAGLSKFSNKKIVKLHQLYLHNFLHDVVAAVAKAPVCSKIYFCRAVGSNPAAAKKMAINFFSYIFLLFYHLDLVIHSSGDVHKTCGPTRRRGSI